MSGFGKPIDCINGCGGMVYFDRKSYVGHPTVDKSIPLEYKDGLKTDQIHECSKRPNLNAQLLSNAAAAATTTAMDNLAVIKQIAAALNEYMAIK